MNKIYTIGYEGVGVDDFIAALKKADIRTLLDVRAVPLSRKPGFSKNKLAGHLADAGIGYVSLKELGTPAEGRAAAKANRPGDLRRIYGAHLKTPEAQAGLTRVIEMAGAAKCCLLCFEHAPECCHRLLVAEAMAEKTGQEIVHLNPVVGTLL